MKHEKTFRTFVVPFDDPDKIDDRTMEMYRPDHEYADDCDCIEPQLTSASCGELRCLRCGGRVA